MTRQWLSRPAVLWAMDDAPGALADGLPARLRYPLVAVARYAGEDGRGAYPSAAEVARITGKSASQARRDLAALARLGLLLPGDPGLVKEIRADRRPNVYDLPMPRGASGRTPSGEPRGASRRTPVGEPRGASGDSTGRMALPHGVRPDAPEESLKRSRTSPARDPRAILAGLGADERLTEFIIAKINDDHRILDPAAYLLTIVGHGDGDRFLSRARRALADADGDPPPPPKPPWCGECDRHSRFREADDDEGRPYKCPKCHPDRVRP